MLAKGLTSRAILILAVVLLFSLAGVAVVWLVRDQMHREALDQARERARNLLDRNLAIHTYFSHQLKPKVFQISDKCMPADHFEPAWMSSTYAVRGIDRYFDQLAKRDYYYKECAINARSPQNEADDYERAFIEQMKADPRLQERSDLRLLEGRPYFVFLRRGESMEADCLRCHSQPDRAPRELVERYGPLRSFGRSQGELVSAISIRVPLAAAYARNSHVVWQLSALLLGVLAVLVLAIFLLNRHLFLRPLNSLRAQAEAMGSGGGHLGEQVAPVFGRDWDELVRAFNRMSANLKASQDELERRVRQRTEGLKATTLALEEEVAQRRAAEDEKEKLIAELRQALSEVKQLGGLLPICAHCKKIRDDQGYWQRLETYIHTHTDANFSHGICPDCIKEIYPGLDLDDPGKPPRP